MANIIIDRDEFINDCFRGHFDKVQSALDNGMSPNGVGSNGQTPLLAAINGEHLEIVECLVTWMVDVNEGDWTPLHEVFDCLIDGMIQDNRSYPNPELIKILDDLISCGADVNAKNKEGYRPIDSLNTYASDIVQFNALKDLIRPSIPNIDTIIMFESR